jgi:hypothetical protein
MVTNETKADRENGSEEDRRRAKRTENREQRTENREQTTIQQDDLTNFGDKKR